MALASERLCYPELPLAIYREVAAHLQQLEGVMVELLPPTHTSFAYGQSQVGGLRITYGDTFDPGDRRWVEAIVAFYAQRYGQPQREKEGAEVLIPS